MSKDAANEMHDLMSRARSDLQACKDLVRFARQDERKTAEQLAGPFLEQMLQSAEAAESLLASANSKVRMAAMLFLREHWKPSTFQELCENLVMTDADEQVRNLAVISLGRFFKGSKDSDAGRFLAKIVHDSTRTSRMRLHAYTALMQIQDLPVDSWPAHQEGFAFPDDVDWSLVDSFLPSAPAIADR